MAILRPRVHKKPPPPDDIEEPSPKRACPKTPAANKTPALSQTRRTTAARLSQAPKPRRLTKRNLRLLEKMTQIAENPPSTGAPQPAKSFETVLSHMSSSTTSNFSESGKTKSTTSADFQVQARANGILAPRKSKPARNAGEILDRLNQRRESASPTQSQYEHYRGKIDRAGNEHTVMQQMFPLFKDYDATYNIDVDRVFSALPTDCGFNDGLSAPRPDFVQGLERDEFRPVSPSEIPGSLLFQGDDASTMLPHFAGEWKSRSGDMVQAALQAGYDGAAMAYGRCQAREYIGEPDPPSHSAITTFVSNGEHITFFAHHVSSQTEGGEDGAAVLYHQHRLTRTDLTASYQSFKKGRRQLRNAQDYAREKALALRDELREYKRSC